MNTFVKLLLLCTLSLGHVVNQAHATLISMDSAFGSDTITLDTETGLRWLDVTLSTDYSYLGVLSELGDGGAFDGFRVATRDEVSTLFTNADIPTINTSFVEENYAPVLSLMNFVGITGHNGNLGTGIPFDYTAGHAYDPTPPNDGWVWIPNLGAYEPDATARASIYSYVPVDNVNNTHGTWLVGITSVPEPATLTLLGYGLIALGFGKKKKQYTC